jgi:O-acetyl-ADP-ribose deacetylase (regulator of RNase III)
LKIILTSRETDLTAAWRKHCGELEMVAIHEGSILDVACDAVVSPANSFGFMDGGIDALYSERFGWHVQDRLRHEILNRHHGELVIGSAEIVETDHLRMRYLIAAPTMRVPMALGSETVNPYLATRAVLLLVKNGTFPRGEHAGKRISERVESIAFPGMGTGVGRVPFDVCARQVRAAIDDVILDKFQFPQSWAEASENHQRLYSDRLRRLQS